MMLKHLGEAKASRAIVAAFEDVLKHGGPRTPDLGGSATTEATITQAVQEKGIDQPVISCSSPPRRPRLPSNTMR